MLLKEKKLAFIDIELANPRRTSICSLALICVSGGKVESSYSYLINPKDDFAKRSVEIHGITADMVEGKPSFPEIWNEIVPMLEDRIIIAHGAASMDLNSICQTLEYHNLPVPTFSFFCTYQFMKRTCPAMDCYKLPSLCEKYGIELCNHHDALCDARACMQLFDRISDEFCITDDFIEVYNYHASEHVESSFPKPAKDKSYISEYLQKKKPSEMIDFQGKKFCLTGDFCSGAKSEIENYIHLQGGSTVQGVSKKVSYVVVGGLGSGEYKFGNYGTKVLKAMEIQKTGINIQIIQEEDLFSH